MIANFHIIHFDDIVVVEVVENCVYDEIMLIVTMFLNFELVRQHQSDKQFIL